MSCFYTLTGIPADCQSSVGGIKRVGIIDYSYVGINSSTSNKVNVNTYNDLSDTDSCKLTDGISNYMQPFEFKKGSSSMTSTATIDATNGVNFWTTELSMQFSRMETAKRVAVQAVTLSDCGVVVEDNNGKLWFLGQDAPVTVTAGTAQTGQAKTDGNFYQITLSDESAHLPIEITDTNSISYFRGLF